MNSLKAAFRYILFLITLIAVIWLLFWGLSLLGSALLPWFFDLSKFWMFVLIVFFTGLAWKILSFFITLIMAFVAQIPVNKEIGYYTVMVVAILNALSVIYYTWTLPVSYSGVEIFVTVIANIFILAVSFSIIGGALRVWDEDRI